MRSIRNLDGHVVGGVPSFFCCDDDSRPAADNPESRTHRALNDMAKYLKYSENLLTASSSNRRSTFSEPTFSSSVDSDASLRKGPDG